MSVDRRESAADHAAHQPPNPRKVPHGRPNRRRDCRRERDDPDARRRQPPGRCLPPLRPRQVPHPRLPHALRTHRPRSPRDGRLLDLPRLRGRHPGHACPLRLRGRRVRAPRERGPRRLRHHRVGRRPALVDRLGRHLRPVLPRRGAVHGRGRVAALTEGADARLRLNRLQAELDLPQRRRLRARLDGRLRHLQGARYRPPPRPRPRPPRASSPSSPRPTASAPSSTTPPARCR